MAETTQRGIAALKSGDRSTARQLLGAAVKENPNDVIAWLWLSGAVDDDEARMDCLRQVLRIDPGNTMASKGLAQIQERRARQAPPPPQHPPASVQPLRAEQPAPPPVQQKPEPSAPHSPWATVQDAADSVASAVYGLRSELSAIPEETVDQPAEEPVSPDIRDDLSADSSLLSRVSEIAANQENAVEAEAAPAIPPVQTPPPDAGQEMAVPVRRPAESIYTAGYATEAEARVVFRTRPSIALALLAFWVFFFGSIATTNLLSQADALTAMLFGLVIGISLQGVVIYVLIHNLRTHYELTSQYLSMPFRRKKVRIQIPEILHAEYKQTMLQRLLGLGDIYLDASVEGELARVRLRDVAKCQERTQQILYLVKDRT